MKRDGYCTSSIPKIEYEVKTNCLKTCEFCGEHIIIKGSKLNRHTELRVRSIKHVRSIPAETFYVNGILGQVISLTYF